MGWSPLPVALLTVSICSHSLAQSLPAAPAGIQTATIQGISFSRVAASGNAPYETSFGPPRGAVPYEYWMARTELTAANYAAFLNAYMPYWPGSTGDWGVTGRFVGRDPDGVWRPLPGFDQSPVTPTLGVAMRYCNWLTSGAPLTADAATFEHGAYETAGISPLSPTPAYAHVVPSAGAVFRLPTVDEWIKAMYFDPARNGTDSPGYWPYPIRRDTPPVSGYPELGGETSAGGGLEFEVNRSFPVAWFPTVQSPWGLFDGSGSATEFLTTPTLDGGGFYIAGTPIFGQVFFDHIDLTLSSTAENPWLGIRLVCVPTPGAAAALFAGSLTVLRRRRI